MFRIDPKVTEYFHKVVKMDCLEDFQRAFGSIDDVPEMLDRITDLDEGARALQISRVRQAWVSITEASQQAADSKKRGLDRGDDLEDLMDPDELKKHHDLFWGRYHVKFHPATEPSDLMVSKAAKRMEKRMIVVDDVWSTKSLKHQTKVERKRHRVSGGLELVETEKEVEQSMPKTLFNYLQLLFTYMLAYSRAGAVPMRNAPALRDQTRDTDTTLCVLVPLDVALAYHDRAQRQSTRMLANGYGEQQVLQWLITHDEDDRAIWVERLRQETETSLGKIIRETMAFRDSSWQAPEPAATAGGGMNSPTKIPRGIPLREIDSPTKDKRRRPDRSRPNTPPPFSRMDREEIKMGPIYEYDKKNRGICRDWNRGYCKAERCTNGLQHVCNAKLSTGKACSMANHRHVECFNPKRADGKGKK